MDLYARVKADNKRIIGMSSALFTLSNGLTGTSAKTQRRVRGMYSEPGFGVNAQGQAFVDDLLTVSFHLADITIASSGETFENWRLTFINNIGETRTGRFEAPKIDRTVGMLTVNVRLEAEAEE
jgi:hypothetical protein